MPPEVSNTPPAGTNPAVAPTAPTAPVTDEPQITKFDLNVRGTIMKWFSMFQKHRGKVKAGEQAGKLDEKFRPLIDPKLPDPFAQVRQVVGAENLNREITKLIYEIADDAAEESVGADGRVHAPTLAVKFCEGFLPGTRRSGTGKRQLQERISELTIQLQPFMKKTLAAMKDRSIKFTPEEELAHAQLLIELGELNQKLEKKERKGK